MFTLAPIFSRLSLRPLLDVAVFTSIPPYTPIRFHLARSTRRGRHWGSQPPFLHLPLATTNRQRWTNIKNHECGEMWGFCTCLVQLPLPVRFNPLSSFVYCPLIDKM